MHSGPRLAWQVDPCVRICGTIVLGLLIAAPRPAHAADGSTWIVELEFQAVFPSGEYERMTCGQRGDIARGIRRGCGLNAGLTLDPDYEWRLKPAR